MLTSDQEALLATVIATPDDDAPRLIYADWLDEQGQSERAEFIRVQIELARMPRWRDPPMELLYQERLRRAQSLLTPAWMGHRFRVGESLANTPSVRFYRGFPHAGHVTSPQLRSLLVDIMHQRLLRDLKISAVTEATLDLLFSLPSLAHLEHLRLRSDRSMDSMANWNHFTRIPEAPNLRALSLTGGQMITIWAAQQLANVKNLAPVTELRLNVPHQAPMLDILLAGDAFQQLRVLHSNAQGYTPYFPNILELPRLANLEELSLTGHDINNVVAEELVEAPFWPSLQSLTIQTRYIADSAAHIITQREAPCLTTLRMDHYSLPMSPAASPLMKHVQELEITSGLPPHDSWLSELGHLDGGHGLRSLRFSFVAIEDAYVLELAQCGGFRALNELAFVGLLLSDQGAMALVQSPHLAHLATLEIRGSPLQPETIAALNDRFPNVQLIP